MNQGPKVNVAARIPQECFSVIQARSDKTRESLTESLIYFLELGIATEAGFNKTTAALEELLTQFRESAEMQSQAINDSLKELGIARKNIGKATQASLANLSLSAWAYHDLFIHLLLSDDDIKDTPIGERIEFWANASVSDLFDFFLSSGGALQRDPKMNYYPSFNTALKGPFKGIDSMQAVGASQDTWEKLSGQSNDATALRKAQKKSKKRNSY